jgi:hypothetical protein
MARNRDEEVLQFCSFAVVETRHCLVCTIPRYEMKAAQKPRSPEAQKPRSLEA